MFRIYYYMGWFTVIVAPLAVIAFIIAFVMGERSYLFVKMIWIPFAFAWGLKTIRKYRQHESQKERLAKGDR